MSASIHYQKCPVCNAATVGLLFTCRDHSVSGEEFPIWQCRECLARFTQDVPDIEGIAKYYQSENYISHTGSNRGLVNKLYLAVRRKTLRQKRKLIIEQTGQTTGRLLDIGSGTGAFVCEMSKRGWQTTGLEPSAVAREKAKKDFHISLQEPPLLFQLQPGSFDAITLWHVLEHVHDLHSYMKQLKLLLHDNGKLFIAVPNYTSADAEGYQSYWAAYDVPRHLYHFAPKSIKKLLELHGLHLAGCRPMWYDSYYISILSSKYKNGKSSLMAAFINGLRSNLKAWRDAEKCSSVIYIAEK